MPPRHRGFAALVVARFGQGIAAALVAPAAMVLLRALLPEPSHYARAMATWGGLSVLGATTGMTLSGVVTTWVSWRWMFAVPLLVSAATLLLAPRLLPQAPPHGRAALDLPGAVLATSGVTLLSYGLVATGDHAWSSAAVAVPLVSGLVLLAAFAVVESRGRDPLLPPAFLADPRRVVALLAIGLSAAATAAASLFLALYLQQIAGWSPLATSLAFVPYTLALVAVGRVAGPLVRRRGARLTVAGGLAVAGIGLLTLVRLHPDLPFATGLLPALLLLPAGVALSFAGAAVLTAADVPPRQTGLAGGVMNTAMELGPTVGSP